MVAAASPRFKRMPYNDEDYECEGKVRGGRTVSSYKNLVDLASSCDTEECHRSGKLGPGLSVETLNRGDGYTSVEVSTGDMVGLLHKVNKCLCDMGLQVVAASVSTDEVSGIALEKYKVIDNETNRALPQDQHARLQTVLVTALQEHTGETVRAGQELSTQLRSSDVVDFDVFNPSDSECTHLRMKCHSRPGLFEALTSEMLALELSVVSLTLNSNLSVSNYLVHLKTLYGERLDSAKMAKLKSRLCPPPIELTLQPNELLDPLDINTVMTPRVSGSSSPGHTGQTSNKLFGRSLLVSRVRKHMGFSLGFALGILAGAIVPKVLSGMKPGRRPREMP